MAQIGVMVSIISGVAGQLTLHPVYIVRQRVLQGMHLNGYQGCHNLASCLASNAHCDSSMRCKDDVTGAGVVAGARSTLARISTQVTAGEVSVVLQHSRSLAGFRRHMVRMA